MAVPVSHRCLTAAWQTVAGYKLTPDSRRNLLTVSLVWHIAIAGGVQHSFDNTAVLHDLDLHLYDATADKLIAKSASRGNNNEHLW